ncbi:MAG: glycoside hydrolase family 9 protein [Bacteroidota bacterium]
MYLKRLLVALIVCQLMACSTYQVLPNAVSLSKKISDQIRINQIGYYPKATKQAVVVMDQTGAKFQLIDGGNSIVLEGQLSAPKTWDLSGETVQIADFSNVKKTGTYFLLVENLGRSHSFEIKDQVFQDAYLGSIKGMYYQRMSTPLEEKHAGKWHRAMAHADDQVLYHPSSGKSEGFRVSPKGWYDAGDYNKYVVNGSFPIGQFLLLEEHYPGTVQDNILNIPESGNGQSDYLDELKYELDWLLTMQDDDGGLFHKLTAKRFEGMVMPKAAKSQRYIVGKGTAATLDFAAAMAKAYRVYLPSQADFAQQCLEASKRAYQWAKQNPEVIYRNPEDIVTGEYGDDDFQDEWTWADAELYISTQDQSYLQALQKDTLNFTFKAGESWTGFMRFLGYFALLEHKTLLPSDFYQTLKEGILKEADRLAGLSQTLPYFQPVDDFHWGSNSDILNAAMILAQAYRLDKRPQYLTAVQQSADYIFGTNAVGYSYLTGFGDRTPMFIHHRQSAADGIAEPVPGLLSGGPNSRQQDAKDGTVYPDNAPPMQSWVDQEPSYASNEICLNWNAPLTYILGFLEQESK